MKLRYIVIQGMISGLILVIFIFGFQNTQDQVGEKDLERVKEAIQKAALECYSIEGKYPREVSYLMDHYGLLLQTDLYSVRYEYIAENIMPSTNIYVKQDKR